MDGIWVEGISMTISCPKCNSLDTVVVSNGIVKCKKCGKRFKLLEIEEDEGRGPELLLG